MSLIRAKYFFTRSDFRIALLISLLCVGAVIRLHSLTRSLWLDEAWVANAAYSLSLKAVFWNEKWLQTTPPLFMLILRAVFYLTGYKPEILRLVPALFAILSLILFMRLSFRLLDKGFAMFALSLFVFSEELILWSLQLKQYSSDVFVTLILLLMYDKYFQKPSSNYFFSLVLISCLLLFLSYQAIFFTPLLILINIFDRNPSNLFGVRFRVRYKQIIVAIIFVSTAFFLDYFFFIVPNTNFQLFSYWSHGFFSSFDLKKLYWFYKKVFSSFIYPIPFFSRNLKITVLLFLGGIIGLILTYASERFKRFQMVELMLTPIVTIIVMNFLRKFPLGINKLSLFLSPIFLLVVVYGIQFISVTVTKNVFKSLEVNVNISRFSYSFGLFLAILVILGSTYKISRNPSPFLRIGEWEDIKGAMQYISDNSTEYDILYVHASMREQFELYLTEYPIMAKSIIFGNVGWPCCLRQYLPYSDTKESLLINIEIEDILSAIDDFSSGEKKRTLRLLFTARKLHWDYISRYDPEIFQNKLFSAGYRQIASKRKFSGVLIEEYLNK